MKIVVCMKQVPDTTTRVQVAADGKSVEEANVTFIVNPYDEFAVEEALKLKESKGGEVIMICIGPERASAAIRTCLAMGADRAIQVKDAAAQHSDPLGVARILAAAIKTLQPDVILTGRYGVGEDHSQVPAILAELLDLPQVSSATKIEWQEGAVRAHREIEGGVEIVECSLPAVITAQKGLNEPRYASLKGIMAAKKKEILEMDLAALGLDASSVGAAGRKMVIEKISMPPARGAGKTLTGEPADVVKELVEWLHAEAKVI
jgi:electron transfer flavoprotein beta subunit